MSETEELEQEFSFAQVAKKLNVNKSTVRRWISLGRIKPVRCYGHRTKRIPASALTAFLEARTV